jgi:D-beta-D-heptose 7-phosphate kinase/D-beta-D-heptose 1-phosphate adenosyltransferase
MTDPSRLLAVLDRLAGVSVGCIGDVMLDRFVHGSVERISPEAPVPVLRVAHESTMLGGAGNVVRNLAALGASVRFAAVVGDDAPGREIARRLREQGSSVACVLHQESGRRTGVKTRFLAGDQQILRADDETIATVSAAAEQRIMQALADWSGGLRALVLSDYAKGVLTGRLAPDVIAVAGAHDVPVVVDPKGLDFGRYAGAAVVTPNRRELAEALGATVGDGEELEAARALRLRCGVGAVLLTLGREGMLLVDEQDTAHPLPAEAREVFDVSGAGDTVAAWVAAALAAGAELPDAAALANAAAGIVVGKVGTAVVRPREVARALRHGDTARTEGKLLGPDELMERLETWRRRLLRIGFTNGCFDLIHPGHVSLLRQARAACDRLVVGLNSDASVTRLKGPGRPVQPQMARATVLASFADVDAVVVFEEDTPAALIARVRPDVLVKGADYRLDQVVGADLVQGYGGQVLLARLEPGFSTTQALEKLAR